MSLLPHRFVCLAITIGVAGLLPICTLAAEPATIFRVERSVICQGTEKFHFAQARSAVISVHEPIFLVTLQEIEEVGAHGYRDIYQLTSGDGQTWSQPEPIESLRRRRLPSGDEIVAGDLSPQWHAKTNTVLSTGKTFTFHEGKREDRLLEQVSYVVCSNQNGKWTWGELKTLALPERDHAGHKIVAPNTGCCQRVDLANGDILLPIRYRRSAKSTDYATMVAHCRFDGAKLTYVEHGSELTRPGQRGFYEPSLAKLGGCFYLTLRTDDSAFVARSSDGLNFDPPVEWKFDDGTLLGSYNTQQHWLAHGDELYLIYTRRGADNDHIFRHRAPLFIARVDVSKLVVKRATEQVLVPQNHSDLGNFGVSDGTNIFGGTPGETWVVVAELPSGQRQTALSEVILARLVWSTGAKP